jgi:hypothetical protein
MPNATHALSVLARTWPALRLVASVFALLWGRSPWGRASLRLSEPYQYETQCMMGISALPPSVDNHLCSAFPLADKQALSETTPPIQGFGESLSRAVYCC